MLKRRRLIERLLAIAMFVIFAAGLLPRPVVAFHPAGFPTAPLISESTWSSFFPNPAVLAVGALFPGPGFDSSNPNDSLWVSPGAVGRLQSAAYAGVGAASGLFAYVYQVDCTGGNVDNPDFSIPLSGATLNPILGALFVRIAPHSSPSDDTPFAPLPTTLFTASNLGLFHLSEFGLLSGTIGDDVFNQSVVGGSVVVNMDDSGVFWSSPLLIFVADKPPVISHVTITGPVSSGPSTVAAVVPKGAPEIVPPPGDIPGAPKLTVGKDFVMTDVNFTATPPELGTKLPEDANGTSIVSVVFGARNVVRSTNPGQIYARVKVETGVNLTSIFIADTLPVNWTLNPEWKPNQTVGSIRVLVLVNVSLTDITNGANINVTVANATTTIVTVGLNMTAAFGRPLRPGDALFVYIKLQYALRGTVQDPNSYPRFTEDRVEVKADGLVATAKHALVMIAK